MTDALQYIRQTPQQRIIFQGDTSKAEEARIVQRRPGGWSEVQEVLLKRVEPDQYSIDFQAPSLILPTEFLTVQTLL